MKMKCTALVILFLLMIPWSTIGLTTTDPVQDESKPASNLHIVWMNNLTMELRLPNNMSHTIYLIPAISIASVTAPCLFSGKLDHDQHSVVAVAGCKDSQETSISIASRIVPGGLLDISIVGGVTYIITEDTTTNILRYKREANMVIDKDDFLIPPPVQTGQGVLLKPSAISPLPDGVVVETSIRYDNSLLRQFGGSHTATKVWIVSVVELAKPRLSHESLNVEIHINVVGNIHHQNEEIKADSTTIQGLKSRIKTKSLVSYFAADICSGSCTIGIAYVGAACRMDGYAININEYYSNTNSEIKTARTFVHELGHNMGMWHDFDDKHGGSNGPCNGKGLMSYGNTPDAWSSCSNADFASWYRDAGFTCLKNINFPVSPCSIYTNPIYHFSGWKPKCTLDSHLVFDPRFYLATYRDLRCAFIKPGINTFDVAAQHWCNYGVKEGRQGIASFSSKAYLARYGDLRNTFGNNNFVQATTHFINTGFIEARNGQPTTVLKTQVGSCSIYKGPLYHFSGWKPKCDSDSRHIFDPRFYLATYNDLRCAFIKPGIKTFDVAAQHWCDNGVKEGRQGIANFRTRKLENSCILHKTPLYHFSDWTPKCSQDSNLVFDPRFYLATYNDLRCAFIKPGIDSFAAASQHWCDYGVKEGRHGIQSFHNKAYLARYKDLQKAYGKNNVVQATTHFINTGFNEGRSGYADIAPSTQVSPCSIYTQPIYHFSGWKPKCVQDSNLVFDPRFYLATYNDLRCAFIKPGINTFDVAAQHWCNYGVKEGRQGIASFNSKAYLARYGDLQRAFGNNNFVQATTHFIQYGFKENRIGN